MSISSAEYTADRIGNYIVEAKRPLNGNLWNDNDLVSCPPACYRSAILEQQKRAILLNCESPDRLCQCR